uniref:phospholipase D-like domain-containing protein n=1 Tax=Peptostreptococcus russellii TaxID=215200 RepID=UPI00294254F4
RWAKKGIRCSVFNPMLPLLNVFMNNRDHRKITVIDGKVAFTGGYNIADRYFNIDSPYGHWKDTGVMIKGKAVDSFTVMFLEMWYAINHRDMEREKVEDFINLSTEVYPDAKGIVHPYAENPLLEEQLAENIYLNIAKNAKDYLYIMTPYLLIDDNMNDELVAAAKRGVDVRIITPGIPDKKFVYSMTRSYYGALVRGGVRIYEYTPGFIHAKQHISDDDVAAVGTINMDYRSLYLHFENGVLLHGVDSIEDIKKDFIETLEISTEVTEKYHYTNRTTPMRITQCLLRFFAPLL